MDTVGKLVVTLNGCEVATPGCTTKVNSISAKAGLLITNTLKGELGTVKTSEAASGVGVLYTPVTGTRFLTLAATACTPIASMNGSLAGEATPVNQLQNTGKLVLGATGDRALIKRIFVLGKEIQPEFEALGGVSSVEATDEGEYREAIEVS